MNNQRPHDNGTDPGKGQSVEAQPTDETPRRRLVRKRTSANRNDRPQESTEPLEKVPTEEAGGGGSLSGGKGPPSRREGGMMGRGAGQGTGEREKSHRDVNEMKANLLERALANMRTKVRLSAFSPGHEL